ncbi:hypothetical protein KEJ25_09965 [Candidatus Bathyarchaeota archaeon]|nr:hypothetical protein [Candidatus Bathyarchaeota archaeon]
MRKPPLLLGEIVQRGVKAHLPRDVEEERAFYKKLSKIIVTGTPDFYPESRRSIYELKFMHRKPEVLEHHRLRASMYKWLSNAEHAYLLYCSPRGSKEYEVNDEFSNDNIKSLLDKRDFPMLDWECKLCVYNLKCTNKEKLRL